MILGLLENYSTLKQPQESLAPSPTFQKYLFEALDDQPSDNFDDFISQEKKIIGSYIFIKQCKYMEESSSGTSFLNKFVMLYYFLQMMNQNWEEQQSLIFNHPLYQIHAINSFYQAFCVASTCKLEIKQEEEQVKVEEQLNEEIKQNFPSQFKQKQDYFFKIYPGETKNYYKNIGQKIANFICESFKGQKDVLGDNHIKYFIRMESQKYSRLTLLKLLKSRKGRKICRLFFAQYLWVLPFLKQHKTGLDLYFRFNKQQYNREKQKRMKHHEYSKINVKHESE